MPAAGRSRGEARLFFAFLITAIPNLDGGHYWVEIMVPGAVAGLIVGYATQQFGRAPLQT